MINVSGYWSSYSIDVATILLYELWAIFDELTLAWDHRFKQIILESDSGEVVEVTNQAGLSIITWFGKGYTIVLQVRMGCIGGSCTRIGEYSSDQNQELDQIE